MKITKEIDRLEDFEPWGPTAPTVKQELMAAGKAEEAWEYIEEYFGCWDDVSEGDVNNLLWLAWTAMYAAIGMPDKDADDEDEGVK